MSIDTLSTQINTQHWHIYMKMSHVENQKQHFLACYIVDAVWTRIFSHLWSYSLTIFICDYVTHKNHWQMASFITEIIIHLKPYCIQYTLSVNCAFSYSILANKFHCNLNQNSYIFIMENAFECVVWKRKWWPFCLSLYMLIHTNIHKDHTVSG